MKFFIALLFFFTAGSICCDPLSVLFLGDTYFGESYQRDPKFNRGTNIIEERGYDSFFENVTELLLGSEIAFANLETALSEGNEMPISTIGDYIHFADTKNTPFYLAKYNIKAVTLANNHTFDLGAGGLASTINALGRGGIVPFGAGVNEDSASKPFFREFSSGGKSFRLYVIGCYWQRSFFEAKGYYAGSNKPGVYMLDTAKLTKQIREIKSKDPDAFVVVYPHWGSNYKPVNGIQRTAAYSLINAGADMIIGHAAHTVQETELYKGKWIFYNIGNFIFNAPGRYRSTNAKPYGLIVQLNINRGSFYIRLYPVYTDNKKSDYALRFLTEDETEDCLSVIGSESSKGKLKINKKGFIDLE